MASTMSSELLEEWLIDAVDFYLPRGFFRQVKGTPQDLVARLLPHLEAQEEDQELTEEELDSPEFDLFFLSFDPMRTLYESMDFGAALGPGLDAYVDTVKALARISRGAFNPDQITESWDGPKGPIRISFTVEAKEKTLKVDTWGGMFDFRILLQLNLLIWDTPYRYEMAPMDDILFVTVLTAAEKTELERLRNLAFMVLDLPRNFLPLAGLTPELVFPEDPETPIFYAGTLNENLDRCVGRLRFIIRGGQVEGHHLYEGDAHQEDLAFTGALSRDGKMEGTLRGHITVAGEPRAYEGEWKGRMVRGNRVATGVWQGWFLVDQGPHGDRPDGKQIYKGQWGLLEEESLHLGDPYIARTRAWLEMVWASHNPDDYPWLLPT
jgi:hypothetical protein